MSAERRFARVRKALLAGAVALATALAPLTVASTPAQAAPVVGFNAGNIISDSLFYNGNAMTVAQVQSFMNQQVPRCTIGDPGRTAGMVWGSTTIASKCLRNFTMNTATKAANAYCGAYAGRVGETSAEIITKVGQACGISQKVLLVMLEKEQSLVGDSWPTVRQLDVAMGYGCPDSGPNWSANCDANYYGFQNQVYRAAWQLKVYKALPNSYNYRPFQTNTIQYHPNPACGTSQVYIENWATAALYIYTPYRPNQAALNAGWGTGDGCSSYGNRNFYNFYTSWFGSAQGFTVTGDIGKYWSGLGGENSAYGYPVADRRFYDTRFPGGVWLQSFSGGVILTEMNTGKTVGVPFGRTYDHWNDVMGGLFGIMGAPVGEATSYSANGGGVLQWFQGGLMISTVAQGTVASIPYGEIYNLYNDVLGGIYGELGYPLSSFSGYAGGSLQTFQKGVIARAQGKTELVAVTQSGFYDYYNTAAGGIYGRLGFPTGSLAVSGNGTKTQEFANGYLVQSVGGPVVEISGAVLTTYRAAMTDGLALGAPIGPQRSVETNGGADFIQFESGLIITPRATGVPVALGGGFYEHYNSRLGGFGGSYGYPLAGQRTYAASGGGALQVFQNGVLFAATKAGTVAGMLTASPIYARYNGVEGGIYGWLGYPVADEVIAVDGTRSQRFQNGVITISPAGGVSTLPIASYDVYASSGGASGPLGAQTSATRTYPASGGGLLSFFANGLITQTQKDGLAASLRYDSPIYARYNDVEGGIYGWLGYPVAEETLSGGIRSQRFQNGTIAIDAQNRATVLPNVTYTRYVSGGGASGALGPQSAATRKYSHSGGAWLSFFDGGLIIESLDGRSVAALRYDSPIYAYYNSKAGGIYGSLGYPIADEVTQAGVTTQQFQNGSLVYANGAVTRQ